MSKKRKEEPVEFETILESAEQDKSVEVQEKVSNEHPGKPKLPFAHWFDKMLKAGKVRHYQDEALAVFFKKRGLKTSELEETYNETFKKF